MDSKSEKDHGEGTNYPQVPPPAYQESNSGAGARINRFDTMTSYEQILPANLTNNVVLLTPTPLPEQKPGAPVLLATVPRSKPILVNCPHCLKLVTTEVKPVEGLLTWLSCLGIAFLGGIYGCCLIPFCTPRLKDINHLCPACNKVIAKYERI